MVHLGGMKSKFRYVVAIMAFAATTAIAQDQPDVLDAQILTGWRGADGNHVAGLHITLRDGWKTYWRAPGEAGIPPRFDWGRSRNLERVEITWPAPKPIEDSGYTSIGYDRSVVFPLTVSPQQPGRPVELSGHLQLGVCKDICVPVEIDVSGHLPPGQSAPDSRIVAALAERPFSAAEAGVGRVACRVSPIEGGMQLRAQVDMPALGGRELAVIEAGDPAIWVARPETSRSGGRLVAQTELYHVEGRAFALDRSKLRITVLGNGKAVDIQGCAAR